MYSQCPECNARFRVSAGDLRAAGGTVRCGRCGSAFNALAWLSDALPPSLRDPDAGRRPDELAGPAEDSEGPVGVEFHFTASDIDAVFVDPGDWARRTDTPRQRPEASTPDGLPESEAAEVREIGTELPIVVDSESRPFEDITLEGEGISVEAILGIEAYPDDATSDDSPTDEFELLHSVPDSAYPDDDGDLVESETGPAMTDEDLVDVEPEPTTGHVPESGFAATADDTLDPENSLAAVLAPPARARTRPSRSSVAWSVGGLLLLLALLAQVANHFRQDLVRNSQIGPLLRGVYAWIGAPLSPNWDLAAFELRQWGNGAAPDANGQLAVRASLTNRAAFAQPHPILRLELDDRFGDSIAVRDFEPAEYLKNSSEASRLLGPGASAEAELVLVDPGRDAVGYQLDICLRESAAILRCAKGSG
jgi:predicted Zn finger-like uncharacterized protein